MLLLALAGLAPHAPVSRGCNCQVSCLRNRGPRAGGLYRHYLLRNATNGPVSVHVVRMERRQSWRFESVVVRNRADGLATLRELVRQRGSNLPLAAINGDFYARRGFVPGDPRGLVIQDGELISAPSGGAAFWVDRQGRWKMGTVHSRLTITWPNGPTEELGLNEELRATRPVLYTRGYGRATPDLLGRLGRELVLETLEGFDSPPLRIGLNFRARVAVVSEVGGTPLDPTTLVLAVSTNWMAKNFLPLPQMILRFGIKTEPDLSSAIMAIGGGPILLQGGRPQVHGEKAPQKNLPYTVRHVWERHPRSALGWSRDHFFLVAVDGRLPGLSDGMKLPELARFMKEELGCEEALNLDGGGSSTLWYDGEVRNSPADGEERPVANALFVFPAGRP